MSEATMSDYIKGFDAGVNCVLAEIERLEKTGPISLQELIKHLDPQRDQKTPPIAEKPPANSIQAGWIGLTFKDMPDKWLGNRMFLAGAKWAAKQLKGKNT
jgi:hypothetical protein